MLFRNRTVLFDTPAVWPTLVGAIAAVTAVLAEARLGPRNPNTLNPSSWWGILPSGPPPGTTRGWLAAIAAIAVITLCVCWCALIRATLRETLAPSRLAVTSLGWALPFALGPPLFSRDVYAYAAQGELARHGLDPATHGISALRTLGPHLDSFVAAVDPRWRETHAPYGGTAVFVEKTAAAAGAALFGAGPIGAGPIGAGPIGAVLLLRLVAVTSVVALVMLTLRLLPQQTGSQRTGSQRTALVLALLACNPVTVIHLVGGAHLDALAGALSVAALVVERHRRRLDLRWRPDRRPPGLPISSYAARACAVALACLAGTVKATAFLALAVLLVVHVREQLVSGTSTAVRTGATPRARTGAPRGGAAGAVIAAVTGLFFDLAVATATITASMIAAGFGPTWITALSTAGRLRTDIAPAALLAHLISPSLRLLGVGGHADAVLTCARMLSLTVAAAVIAGLFGRAWRNPTAAEAGTAAWTATAGGTATADGTAGRVPDDVTIIGVGGMAVALGGPVLYPWYLALAVPALSVMVSTNGSPALRRLTIITSVTLCVTSLASLAPTWTLLNRHPPVAVALAAVAALTVAAAMIATVATALTATAAKRREQRPSRR
ncbi:polyprenol phosphomannose-dependent alpha 1,6 mannosyltransferase MptB [Frankia sp. Cr2]|uniref:polyprenol phosphomannose-dependent alpha 1,6 mannosyltransferase MptB n=1 Tax=Frankia sp. Cr2 TaxID=3073932 RepID=UPI003A0FC7D1